VVDVVWLVPLVKVPNQEDAPYVTARERFSTGTTGERLRVEAAFAKARLM
jgi:hypothetical protein